MVRSVGVPGEEAGEVLERAEGLVASNYAMLECTIVRFEGGALHTGCRNELVVVADHRVVDKRVGHHLASRALSNRA